MITGALGSFAVTFLCRVAVDLFQSWQAKRSAVAEGRAEAVAEGQAQAAAATRIARAAEAEAEAAHRADATDGAFDQSFRRD